MKRLVLFDIDGTLVLTGRAGIRALDRALLEICGVTNALSGVAIGGRTDRAIITDALRSIGEEFTTETGIAVRDRYCLYLATEVAADSPHPKLVLPGVSEALAALAPLEASGEVSVGLLTGNFARGAEIKLGYFDLWQRFRFGAFGDGHVDRRDLVPIALEAAERAGEGRFSGEQVVIIGDTPADVDCAHAHGATAIAVATGPYSVDELRETGAQVVVPDLSNWAAVWTAVYPRRPSQ